MISRKNFPEKDIKTREKNSILPICKDKKNNKRHGYSRLIYNLKVKETYLANMA